LIFMHEMGIANSILHSVRSEMARRPTVDVTKVGVRVGELAALDPESLRFCFDALKEDAGLPHLELEIQFCPRRHHCPSCDADFDVSNYDLHCPRCGTETALCVGGDELELAYLEVEEHEPSRA
jgi:hydrogenase nickel incorporation protein HypA/HybF